MWTCSISLWILEIHVFLNYICDLTSFVPQFKLAAVRKRSMRAFVSTVFWSCHAEWRRGPRLHDASHTTRSRCVPSPDVHRHRDDRRQPTSSSGKKHSASLYVLVLIDAFDFANKWCDSPVTGSVLKLWTILDGGLEFWWDIFSVDWSLCQTRRLPRELWTFLWDVPHSFWLHAHIQLYSHRPQLVIFLDHKGGGWGRGAD